MRSCQPWVLLGLACIAVGCGPSEPKLKPVFPVQGSVFFKDQPAAGAVVMFHPLPLGGKVQGLTSRGTVGPDGKFLLTTYNTDDGAPAGEYAVTVYWPMRRTGQRAPDDDSDDLPPDRLGLRYTDPTTTSLKASVDASETQLARMDLR